jgi:2-amino-4-hydroxy-6-hydroxymethyldihydropteridine diphosphokinase
MAKVFIGLGSNLGARESSIEEALRLLSDCSDIIIEKVSSVIETDAVSEIEQPKFLNAVIKVRTELSPNGLLRVTQGIENRMGRVRAVKNGPRNIDLDVLLYDEVNMSEDGLIIPHPRMFERRFVLVPLLEIEPQILNHPLVRPHKRKILAGIL